MLKVRVQTWLQLASQRPYAAILSVQLCLFALQGVRPDRSPSPAGEISNSILRLICKTTDPKLNLNYFINLSVLYAFDIWT